MCREQALWSRAGEQAMDTNTMVKSKIPDWIADMFKKIDAKDLKGASA